MKKVFSSHSEVTHVWASQSQETGTAGNISFNGPSISSYHWWEMATFHTTKQGRQICFIRSWNYSNSTSKHMRHMQNAIPQDWEIIRVHGGGLSGYYNNGGTLLDHESNIIHWVTSIINANKVFKLSADPRALYNSQLSDLEKLKEYQAIFKLKLSQEQKQDIKTNMLVWDDIQYYVAGKDKKLAERAEKLEIKRELERFQNQLYWANREKNDLAEKVQYRHLRAIAKPELDNIVNLWRAGDKSVKHGYIYNNSGFSIQVETIIDGLKVKHNLTPKKQPEGYFLKLIKDEVITSGGARVPIREAKILLARIRSGKDIKGFQVGSYTVISINGTLKIGCHEFERTEIEAFTKFYNW